MLYKASPFGYFGRVGKISRGPWFKEGQVEDDGLEWFYGFGNGSEPVYLLSNNIPIEDREKFHRLWFGLERNRKLAWFGGLWLGFETVLRVPYFKKMAVGYRVVSWFAAAFVYKTAFTAYNSITYGPVVSAFLRKYSQFAQADRFNITDRKREYYEIDTSQYMSYDFKDLGHDYHAHHGPQPVITFSYSINAKIIGWRSFG